MIELEELLDEMETKMNRYDLSDQYLKAHSCSTRNEIGIREYHYGIATVPCSWVYPYLKELKEMRNKFGGIKMSGITEDMYYVRDVKSMIDFLNKHKEEINSIYFGDSIETYPVVMRELDVNKNPVTKLVRIGIKSTTIISAQVNERLD